MKLQYFPPWWVNYVNEGNWDEAAPRSVRRARPGGTTAMRHGNRAEIDSNQLGHYFACHYYHSISKLYPLPKT